MTGLPSCNQWKAVPIFALLVVLVQAVPGVAVSAKIRQVIDGDTVVLEDGRRVRYLGINAPERHEPYFEMATALNRRLTEGRLVTLEEDEAREDQYSRLLAYVYVHGEMVNARLIEAGLAHLLVIPPNHKHYDRLLELQRQARAARRGIWESIIGPLKITSLKANAPGNDRRNPNGEYVRIANVDDDAVDIGGYTVTDRHGHRYTFPALTLKPGYSVLLLSGRGTDLTDPQEQIVLYWQSRGPIWNNDGDAATLRAPDGSPVDTVRYRGRRSTRKTNQNALFAW